MRNFITIKNENERKIFLNYCKKHNVVLFTGTRITETFPVFSKSGFQIFFEDDCFDYLTYARSTLYAQYSGNGNYNEIKFKDFFKINVMEIE